jgi:hypothetical protein
MSVKACFRCDWSGATRSDTCPRCGAALQGVRVDGDAGAERETRIERSRWSAVATLGLVVFALIAVVVVTRNTPAAPPPTPPAGPDRGYLVYASPARSGHGSAVRLWVWNLSASTAAAGPLLDRMPSDLEFSYTPTSGAVTATVPETPRRSGAFIVRSLDEDASAERLAIGNLVAWLPSNGYLSIVRTEARGGCHRTLTIDSENIETGIRRPSAATVVCGEATTLGRDLTGPYVTIEHEGRAAIFRSSGTFVPVLRGYRSLSVSLNGDLLVQRPGDRRLLYYYPSSEIGRPTPIGRDGRPLEVDRVLAWNGDGSAVSVLGAIGRRRGVYLVTVSPTVEARSPVLLLRTGAADVSASPTPTGDMYVAADGKVWFVDDGVPRRLIRPAGAPPPRSPMLWISTLPYSRSGTG